MRAKIKVMDVPEIKAFLVFSHSQFPPFKPIDFEVVTIKTSQKFLINKLSLAVVLLGRINMLVE